MADFIEKIKINERFPFLISHIFYIIGNIGKNLLILLWYPLILVGSDPVFNQKDFF